jgi:hypothetical protein
VIGVPTLEQVRAWIQVPASAISDEDLTQILDAELGIQTRTCRVPVEDPDAGPISATLDDMTATVLVTGGPANTHYRLSWGDGQNGDVTLDGDGNAAGSHVYANAGTYTASVSDDYGTSLSYAVTVPGNGELNPQAVYPSALARACLRRCQREVAVRAVPLGAFGVEGSEYGPVTLTSWDAEIARLEATYRIPVIA